jgi:hypothetical protein
MSSGKKHWERGTVSTNQKILNRGGEIMRNSEKDGHYGYGHDYIRNLKKGGLTLVNE